MKSVSSFFLVLTLFFTFISCQNTNVRDDIPRIYVYEEVNLNDFTYNALKLIGGFVYLNSGVRGIIIYKKSQNQYLAFERDCPYLPKNSCALVSMDKSTLYLADTCCTSKFDFDGNPIGGPAQFPVLQYRTTLNQNFLIISSD
jgi:hypothetical protein